METQLVVLRTRLEYVPMSKLVGGQPRPRRYASQRCGNDAKQAPLKSIPRSADPQPALSPTTASVSLLVGLVCPRTVSLLRFLLSPQP